jgi:hypothetical protein
LRLPFRASERGCVEDQPQQGDNVGGGIYHETVPSAANSGTEIQAPLGNSKDFARVPITNRKL